MYQLTAGDPLPNELLEEAHELSKVCASAFCLLLLLAQECLVLLKQIHLNR